MSRHGRAFVQGAFNNRDGRGRESVLEKTVGHFVVWQVHQSEVSSPAKAVAFPERQRVAAQQEVRNWWNSTNSCPHSWERERWSRSCSSPIPTRRTRIPSAKLYLKENADRFEKKNADNICIKVDLKTHRRRCYPWQLEKRCPCFSCNFPILRGGHELKGQDRFDWKRSSSPARQLISRSCRMTADGAAENGPF